MMLDKLTADLFETQLELIFFLDINSEESLALTLSEVTRYTNPSYKNIEAVREPFALTFLGPVEPHLPQSMYVLKNDQIGTIKDIFLVPVGRDDRGCFYQAVFN